MWQGKGVEGGGGCGGREGLWRGNGDVEGGRGMWREVGGCRGRVEGDIVGGGY